MLPLSDAPPGAVRGNWTPTATRRRSSSPTTRNPTDYERTVFAAASYLHTGDVASQLSLYAREIYENFNCDPANALGATADPGSSCSNYVRDDYHFGAARQDHLVRGSRETAGRRVPDRRVAQHA